MRSRRPLEHLNEEQLLAYLDGEMSLARMRSARNHLRICWNCRSLLAELEAHIESISRLLLARTQDDGDRSIVAKEKFLRWRNAFEARRRFFFDLQSLHRVSQHRPALEMVLRYN